MNKVGVMWDIETLDLGSRSVITQIGFIGRDLADPETTIREVHEYLPAEPQLALNRTMSFSTILWWMKQSDEARLKFVESTGNDFDELLALVRSVITKFDKLVNQFDDYEVIAQGPQFDIVNLETLFSDCGQKVPWSYNKVVDLRTLARYADVTKENFPRPERFVAHNAIEDCRWQWMVYVEAVRKLALR